MQIHKSAQGQTGTHIIYLIYLSLCSMERVQRAAPQLHMFYHLSTCAALLGFHLAPVLYHALNVFSISPLLLSMCVPMMLVLLLFVEKTTVLFYTSRTVNKKHSSHHDVVNFPLLSHFPLLFVALQPQYWNLVITVKLPGNQWSYYPQHSTILC